MNNYTIVGGTIGMKVLRHAYEPVTNFLPDALREMNIMHNTQFAETMKDIDTDRSFLYLPLSFYLYLVYNKVYYYYYLF